MSVKGGNRTLGGAHLRGACGTARELGKAHRTTSNASSTHGTGTLPHMHEAVRWVVLAPGLSG
jgi:hypothetical protein